MKVDVIIEKDESGYYVAEVPAFPGCFSQGKTLEESKKNIKVAIQGWIEVMEELGIGLLKKILEQAQISSEEFNEL
jgi:predicted RNase H-like HicB family nuclease